MMSFRGACREQLPSESKRYCEGCPPTAATWNSSGFPDANRRWADNLPCGQRFYADRRPDTRTSRTWRIECRRRSQVSRGGIGYGPYAGELHLPNAGRLLDLKEVVGHLPSMKAIL